MKKVLSLLLVLLLLPLPAPALEGVVYEIFVASFQDADGDGMGDLKGIEEKLPYIQTLHPKALWLMPIHPSPSYHKYDVVDYFGIDPAYGTLEDFDNLAAACKKEGIGLILDLVLNHSSSEHPWFLSAQKSLNIPPCGQEVCPHHEGCRQHNKYVGYYLFSEGSGKHPVPHAEGWYYHSNFGYHMPDLNLDNPALQEDIAAIARFWLDRGVKGFRLDAVIHFYEQHGEKNAAFLCWFNNVVKAHTPDAYIVAEAWSDQGTIMKLYQSGIDSLFDFPVSGADGSIVKALRAKDGETLAKTLAQNNQSLKQAHPQAQNAPFLGNHDTGRIAGVLRRDITNLKLAAALYLLQPGVPFIYYGEEVGMTGSGRDENKRLPMLWQGDGQGLTLPPEGADQPQRQTLGVKEQESDPASLLSFYRALLSAREKCPEMSRGTMEALPLQHKAIAAYTIKDEQGACTVLHNLGDDTISLDILWPGTLLFASNNEHGTPMQQGNTLLLPPKTSCIFK